MTSQPLSFYTLDLGTASSSVALIAPVDGRFRLLAAGCAPSGADVEALLEDLARRVEATDPGLLPGVDGWPDWARLTSVTSRPPRVACAATSDRAMGTLERAFVTAGWEVAARIVAGRTDALAAAEAVLDPAVVTLAVAAGDPPGADERAAVPRLGALLGALTQRRPELEVLLCGSVTGWGRSLVGGHATRLPAPEDPPDAAAGDLRAALAALAARPRDAGSGAWLEDAGEAAPDGHAGLRVAVETLARLLERPVEAVSIGHASASRVLAAPAGPVASVVSADGALVPRRALRDEREIEAIAGWSAIRSDPFTIHDRLRNLAVSPWRDTTGDGARLRLAALRSALGRLDAQWRSVIGRDAPVAPLLIASGGAFAAVPPAASALAVVDGMRRPGALALFHDHARVLAPLGTLPEAADRARLLGDLLDDVLLPLGSVVVASEVRPGARSSAILRVVSDLQQHELELTPGALRLVDLPPGVAARIELETREGTLLGGRDRRVELEVTGGLGGLLVDTREVPLRLPERAERRRVLLEAWERPVWGSADA